MRTHTHTHTRTHARTHMHTHTHTHTHTHAHTQNTGIKGPFLVIAPLSTIANWQREAELWTDFNIIVYHGSAYSRRLIHEYELYHRDDSGKIIPNTYKFDIIITTYEVILCKSSNVLFMSLKGINFSLYNEISATCIRDLL